MEEEEGRRRRYSDALVYGPCCSCGSGTVLGLWFDPDALYQIFPVFPWICARREIAEGLAVLTQTSDPYYQVPCWRLECMVSLDEVLGPWIM